MSIEKMPLSEWPLGTSVGLFFTVGGATTGQEVLVYVRKQAEQAVARTSQ